MEPSFIYRADVVRVVDGDTVDVNIQLGFSIVMRKQRIRLFGINAPEMRTRHGKEVKKYLANLIEGRAVTLRTIKDKKGKYGRWLGIVEDDNVGNVNDWLVKNNMAVRKKY